MSAVRSACQVENDPSLVTAYLCFLSEHACDQLSDLSDLVLDMATLIVERSTIMAAILPSNDNPNPALDAFVTIFYNYLIRVTIYIIYYLLFYYLLRYEFFFLEYFKSGVLAKIYLSTCTLVYCRNLKYCLEFGLTVGVRLLCEVLSDCYESQKNNDYYKSL